MSKGAPLLLPVVRVYETVRDKVASMRHLQGPVCLGIRLDQDPSERCQITVVRLVEIHRQQVARKRSGCRGIDRGVRDGARDGRAFHLFRYSLPQPRFSPSLQPAFLASCLCHCDILLSRPFLSNLYFTFPLFPTQLHPLTPHYLRVSFLPRPLLSF